MSRYGAYSNIIWDVSKEAWRESDSYWATRLPLVHSMNPRGQLVTMHSFWHRSDDLKAEYCDMISDQQHSDFHEHILAVRSQFPSKPVLNIEFQYEQGVVDPYFSDTTVHATVMRKTMWSLCTLTC